MVLRMLMLLSNYGQGLYLLGNASSLVPLTMILLGFCSLASSVTREKRKLNKEEVYDIIHKSELKIKTLNPVWNESLEKYAPDEDFRLIFEGELYRLRVGGRLAK